MNELTIENISADTVIIVTGEIVKGGKQDRIINQDILLAPKSGKKKLTVFCVEKGRWNASSPAGDFKSQHSVGTMSLRKVVEKDAERKV